MHDTLVAAVAGPLRAPGAPPPHEITRLLIASAGGDREALDRVFSIAYAELRCIADRELAKERRGHTLDAVALVSEAYLKLVKQGDIEWLGRAHFFGIAARAMRTILIDYARARAASKRGGGHALLVTLDRVRDQLALDRDEQLIALDVALDRLADVNGQAAQIIEYRYFAGLTLEEISALTGLPVATVRRRCAFARAWLQQALSG